MKCTLIKHYNVFEKGRDANQMCLLLKGNSTHLQEMLNQANVKGPGYTTRILVAFFPKKKKRAENANVSLLAYFHKTSLIRYIPWGSRYVEKVVTRNSVAI